MSGLEALFGRTPSQLSRRWQGALGDHVIALAWAPDRTLLAAAAIGGPITLFDSASGAALATLPGHGFGTTDLSWSPTDPTVLASSGQDGKVKLWKVSRSGGTALDLPGGAAWVEHVAWSSDGQLLASAAGRILKLWDAQGRPLRTYPAHPNTISDIKWQPGKPILASSTYSLVQLWQPDSDEVHQCFQWKGSTLVLSWSPDAKYLATGDQDCTVHFWIVSSGEDLQMSGYPLKVRQLSWDAGSRYLATGGGSMPCVWDCSGKGPANTKPLMFKAHEGPVTALAFQPRGPLLVSADGDGKVVLWQPGKFKKALTERRVEGGVSVLAWSSDDQSLAVGTDSGQVAVLSLL
jgi:WD40 repeat protein